MEKQNSLVKNYIYNALYQLLAIIVPLITTPYVSRVLEAEGLGAYSYTYSIVSYFCIFCRMGLDTYGQLQIAETRDDPRLCSANFWGILTARTILSLIVSIPYLFLTVFSVQYRALYAALSVCIISHMIDISFFYQGVEEFKKTVLRNAITKILSVFLIFLFVQDKDDLVLYALLVQGSVLIGNAALWFRFSNYVSKPFWKEIRILQHFKNSMIYFIPTIAVSVYTTLDKSMLGWLAGSAAENGYYEQAHKIELILLTIVTSLATVTLPRLKNMSVKGESDGIRKIVQTSTNFTLLLSLPMVAGIVVVAPRLVPWFLGDGYAPCVFLLQIFSLLIPIVGLNNIVGKQCLIATGKQKYYNIGVITGAVVNVLLNILLIPKYLSAGAAIASVAAEFSVLAVFVLFSRDLFHIREYIFPFCRYALLSGIMAACAWLIGRQIESLTLGLLLQCGCGVLIYCILLLIFDPMVGQTFKKLTTRTRRPK